MNKTDLLKELQLSVYLCGIIQWLQTYIQEDGTWFEFQSGNSLS